MTQTKDVFFKFYLYIHIYYSFQFACNNPIFKTEINAEIVAHTSTHVRLR